MSAPKRLTDDMVRWIRRVGWREVCRGRARVKDIAEIAGCTPQHVMDIVNRRRRANVPDGQP